jgi:hypothetical protein
VHPADATDRALAEETGGRVNRYASITSVATRLGIDQEEAEALSSELRGANLVLIGGGHSVTLTETGQRPPSAAKLQSRRPATDVSGGE